VCTVPLFFPNQQKIEGEFEANKFDTWNQCQVPYVEWRSVFQLALPASWFLQINLCLQPVDAGSSEKRKVMLTWSIAEGAILDNQLSPKIPNVIFG
jgi:hypothetical protein